MLTAEYPFHMIGGVPVITAPAEIDITTSGELRAILARWHSRGCTTVVVDLTGTVFCDLATLHELMRAHKRAEASGGGLRLVTPGDGAFARIFTITGMDGNIPHFAVAADSRRCVHCGVVFVPVREHARFCGSDCRAAWNREHWGDPAADARALTWSIAAMSDATARLPAIRVWDEPQALAAIGEAVWWITMVDATLIRHHPKAYDTVMMARTPADRLLINETLAGMRFVRNLLSREAWLGEIIGTDGGTRRITGWTWKPVPESALPWLPPPCACMGTGAIPGLPCTHGGPHHRGDLPPDRDVPHAHRRERDIPHRYRLTA